MAKTKLAVTVDSGLIEELDGLIARRRFANRSQAIEAALAEKLERLKHVRLARECAKLDTAEEKRFAEECPGANLTIWPTWSMA